MHTPRVSVTVRLALLLVAVLCIPGLAVADAVIEWSEIAVATAAAGRHGASDASRITALVHAAIFDAVNAIETRYTPYKVKVAAPAGASSEAAAVAAAHTALLRLYPAQKDALAQAYAKSLGRIAEGPARRDGIAVGEQVGAEMVALRASDGATAPNVYRPITTPSVYVVTSLPVSSQWGNVTPWVLERGSQFRPGPPPALTSAEWARDCKEVMDLGGKKSAMPTSPCSRPSTPTTSGARSPRSATVTRTAAAPCPGWPTGSRWSTHRCTPNIRARTASPQRRWRPCWGRRFPRSR